MQGDGKQILATVAIAINTAVGAMKAIESVLSAAPSFQEVAAA